MILSPQQQRVVEELLPVAQIATDGSREGMAIMPRCHSLIVSPSGTGKSYIAREISRILKLPCLVLNVGSWVLISHKSEAWTWTHIVDWVANLQGGGVLVLDEIDKCAGGSEWSNYLRLEIHDLLDSLIQISVPLPNKMNDFLLENPWSESPDQTTQQARGCLEKVLRERVMVIGCGAWQSAWRGNSRQLGFSNGGTETIPDPPSRAQILASIEPELRQRFRNSIILMHPMSKADYLCVAKSIENIIPDHVLPAWINLVEDAIQQAVDCTLGMRVFEELLLQAMVMSREGPIMKREIFREPRLPML
jgi:hypothetical protein